MKLKEGDICSCVYREKLRIVQVEEIRDLTKEPVEGSTSEHYTGSRYLYIVMQYEDGSFRAFYDMGMTAVTILSNRQFINANLKKRFDNFKEENRKSQEMREEIALREAASEEHYQRLTLGDIANNARVRVILDNGKKKTGRYGEHRSGVVYLYNPGINTFTKIPTSKINRIELLGEATVKETDPHAGLAQHPAFIIPEYEKESGYSPAFWSAFIDFTKTIQTSPGHKYRLILPNGGYFDKRIKDYQRFDNDIVLTLQSDNDEEKEFSLSVFNEMVLLEAGNLV